MQNEVASLNIVVGGFINVKRFTKWIVCSFGSYMKGERTIVYSCDFIFMQALPLDA